MRHTPLDGPDRETGGDVGPGDSDGPAGTFDRILSGARKLFERGVEAVGRFVGFDGGGRGAAEREPVEARVHPVERSGQLPERDDPPGKPVVPESRDNRPVPTGTDDGPRDSPELVARWQDGRLTLSEPDEAGARISSDTWSEVDP